MSKTFKFLSLTFMALMIASLVLDFSKYQETEAWDPSTLGAFWSRVSNASLSYFQVIIQRHFQLPELWDPYIVDLLLQPAWVCLLVLSVVFFVLGKLFTPSQY